MGKSPHCGLITPLESLWVEIQPFLLQHGYKLRPRYHPNWKPSWKKPWNFYKLTFECPDYLSILRYNIMDAIRVSDGARVVMKRVFLEEDNVPLLEYLNSPEMRKDPRNNTVPLLEVIPLPEQCGLAKSRDSAVLLIMPLLFPLATWSFPFQHVKEVVEALDQLIQGIVFLHEHRIAHRDACYLNYMMDPTNTIPSSFHFGDRTRQPDGISPVVYKDRCSASPVKYYMIDYETADYFPPNVGSVGRYGQVKTVPEMSLDVPYDPFKLDVYQLGCQVQEFFEEYDGLEFLQPLCEAMMHHSPDSRLTAAESFQKFQELLSSLEPAYLSHEIWLKVCTAAERRAIQRAMHSPPTVKRTGVFASCKKRLSGIYRCLLSV